MIFNRRLAAILVPLARAWLACRKLARRADPPGATVAILCLKHPARHVPRRIGHDGCPVGSCALERQYKERQAS